MANYFGNLDSQLWLACGGLKFLKIESMQPLIDQGRKVWLWPDKDGVEGWQTVADKLGSENVQVYTKFFDACWEPEDVLYHPDWVPREIKSESPSVISSVVEKSHEVSPCAALSRDDIPPKPEGVTDAEWLEHLEILKQISDYDLINPQDAPIIDPEELRDPRLHQWRNTLRQRYNFNKTKTNGNKEK